MPFLFGYPITIGSFSGPAPFVCAHTSPDASKPLLTTAAPGTATNDAPMNLRRPLSKTSLLMVYSSMIAASVVGQVRCTRAVARQYVVRHFFSKISLATAMAVTALGQPA